MQLICSINAYPYENIMLCDSINNHIIHQEDKEIVWKLKQITEHEEPLNSYHPNYKGGWCDVMVEWDTGRTTT